MLFIRGLIIYLGLLGSVYDEIRLFQDTPSVCVGVKNLPDCESSPGEERRCYLTDSSVREYLWHRLSTCCWGASTSPLADS